MTAADVRVVPVTSEEQRRQFAKFPWHIYKNDPYWVPPLYMDRLTLLNPAKHPFYEHADVQLFLAMRGEEIVGTICAHVNHLHNQTFQDKVGFFGFFEVIEDHAVAKALLDKAADWLRERGMEAIRGPESLSQNEECGLLVDGFDMPPVILMTYNPRYYQQFIEQSGFEKAQDLYAWDILTSIFDLDVQRLPRKFLRVAEQAKKRENLVVRPVDMKRFDQEVELVKHVYNLAWEQNWGFVALTENEIEHLAAEMKMILDPDLVFIAEVDGQPAGITLGLPDVYQALLKAKPQPNTWSLPFTLGKFLWHRRKVNNFRLWALGVVPEYRALGIDAALIVETARSAFAKGYQRCEMSWILESNDMMNRIIERLGGEV
ncbi:MAG TPA: GNAT family N-acetyltransferase, partial [Anaerolineae bacterium]|nr:GNAT family N-acetyltransferase [Anaerolineae bacterium]